MAWIAVSRQDASQPGAPLGGNWEYCPIGHSAIVVDGEVGQAWFNKQVNNDRSIHVYKSGALRPGVNLYKVDPEGYPTATSELKDRSTSKGKAKEWEQAKKDGKIVLKPMFAHHLKASGSPSISSAKVDVLPNRLIDANSQSWILERYGIQPPPGVCNRRYHKIPEIGYDMFAPSAYVTFDQYNDPYVAKVPEETLKSIMLDIISHLDRLEPNGTIVTKTVAEANSATFDLATEIGEMPETIKMILDGVMGGIKLLLRAKKEVRQNLSSGSVVGDAASLWMAYRYGLMPIVYSINDGLDLLEMENRKFQSFRGRIDLPAPEFSARGYSCVEAPTVENRCFLKYGYDLESSIHQGLKLNLVATAWELIPLSFVWDWFFQVGDYLTAMFTPGVVNQIGCTFSYRVNGQYVFRNDKHSVINVDVDYYRNVIINPNSFIGINSEVFISFKRSMDALSLSWLLFKKKN